MKLLIKTKYIDKQIDFFKILVGLIWMSGFLLSYVKAAILRIPLLKSNPDIIVYCFFIGIAFFSLNYIVKNIKFSDICIVGGIIFIYALNYIIFSENYNSLNFYVESFLCMVVPLYFVGRVIKVDQFFKMLYYISFLTIVARLFYFVFFEQAMEVVQAVYEGDMVGAYLLLPHLCLVCYWALKYHKVKDVFVTFLGFIFLLFLGNRGALGCFCIYIVSYFIFICKIRLKLVFFLTSIISVIWLNLSSIIFFLYNKAFSLGLSVRLFDKYLSDELFVSESRDSIHEILWDYIYSNSILGNGIGASNSIISTYPHNVLIEFWLEFGLVMGSLLLIILFGVIIKGFFSTSCEQEKVFILILICSCLLKLFLSGTYLDETYFFMLIGLCVQMIKKGRLQT